MHISLSEQIRLAALEHHLSDQYPDLAAEMKVFDYCHQPRAVAQRRWFGLTSWARHMAVWTAGIAVVALLALLLLPAFGGPTRCVPPAAGSAHPAGATPAACPRVQAGG
jgi:hypothetical protein